MVFQQKNLFTNEECLTIKSWSKKYTTLFQHPIEIIEKTKNGRFEFFKNIDGKNVIRKSYNVYDIPNNEETNWMFEKLYNWFTFVNNIQLNQYKNNIACTLHCYKIGDKFNKHIDAINEYSDRKWNIGIQLSDECDYVGGNYLWWDEKNKQNIFSKDVGTAISYSSLVPHEITEIIDGERWSIVIHITNHYLNKKLL